MITSSGQLTVCPSHPHGEIRKNKEDLLPSSHGSTHIASCSMVGKDFSMSLLFSILYRLAVRGGEIHSCSLSLQCISQHISGWPSKRLFQVTSHHEAKEESEANDFESQFSAWIHGLGNNTLTPYSRLEVKLPNQMLFIV